MKIYLFTDKTILTFNLPNRVLGTFSFDDEKQNDNKLINIVGIDNKWVLKDSENVKIMKNGVVDKNSVLNFDDYIILQRNNKQYIMYISNILDKTFKTYKYDNKLNLIIGNKNNCNICFSNNLISNIAAKIIYKDNSLFLEVGSNLMYLNDNVITKNNVILKNGDKLNLVGLIIYFFNGFFMINNPNNKVNIDINSANISMFDFQPNNDELKDIDIVDSDLYQEKDFFSKSPRLRRCIKTKEISLSPPPRKESSEEMPLLLTIGPMLTMSLVSLTMLMTTISKINEGQTTMKASMPTFVSSGAMILSTIMWPILTKNFNKKLKIRKAKELVRKYTAYLNKKEQEFIDEEKLQRTILNENYITIDECLKIIDMAKLNFWDKRIEQNDFLDVRLGIGNVLLDVDVKYPEEGFTIEEDELKQKADALVEKYKYIKQVPLGYSLFKNKITAIMNENVKAYNLVNSIALQLLTFYSYEDIKFVIFTSKNSEYKWEYFKYLNHTFSNDKSIRLFAVSDEDTKNIENYLMVELQNRVKKLNDKELFFKPHYIILTDNYSNIKRHDFFKSVTEIDQNVGFSLLAIEDRMSKLPSKCNNFILLGNTTSEILKNSLDEPEQIIFKDEVLGPINMMTIAKKLSNIPIEFEDGFKELPDAITFLEMEKVGNVEQLNILNRWENNDSTASLKAEVGVDEYGNLMYLDLHEKFHGPHGLIAGMTGSGKSEFIITYILSMAINYSPNDIAFILIDYKGGGLAFAFENKATGICLPHLAGTITNLDKAEMDRTLVSIDSEIKRRQTVFNNARDILGESTIDIYKYQKYFKEGKLKEPVPHLFIICDEFAELKSQQPEFMDNLISVARIGRSLGVHLILATQKPSGVVNDQIWSNTKFRVCLKVQDESDSKEMLKRPEAASLKQTGRFYLQVGFDELFALGQSAWCGAKYYPSDKIIKQVDKSVNVIDNCANHIKSIQAGNNIKINPEGEQLAAIMKNIINVANQTNLKCRRLWLNDIDPFIYVDNLEQKYNFVSKPYNINAILGEYDAPEKQVQGLLTYSLNEQGNTTIFGNDEVERENLINTLLYSILKHHTADEINVYIIDYGSESLRVFSKFPQIGGMVFMGDDEKFKNLFKMIIDEIKNRKKLLIQYGGSIEMYNSKNEKKLPRILFILNNYEAITETYSDIYEEVASIGRDCDRYGIILLLVANTPSTLGRRVTQCFENKYSLHLSDSSDYFTIFNKKSNVTLRETLGRGLVDNDGIHEFQTSLIVNPDESLLEYLEIILQKISKTSTSKAQEIPVLPDVLTYNYVQNSIESLENIPIGMSKENLKIIKFDFKLNKSTTISSNKLININCFIDSLIDIFIRINGLTTFFIDVTKDGIFVQNKNSNKNLYYLSDKLEENIEKLTKIEEKEENKKFNKMYIFYGIGKISNKIDSKKISNLLDLIKSNDNSTIIFCDSMKNIKNIDYESWFSNIKNNSDGIWIGKGFGEQQVFRITRLTKEMNSNYPKNYALCVKENSAEFMRPIEFNKDKFMIGDEDDEE